MFIKITLFSAFPLSIVEKKAYVDSFYPKQITYNASERNQGFFSKFNNAIGFKKVTSFVTNESLVIREEVPTPEEYIAPNELLQDSMRIPVASPHIVSEFYIPVGITRHPVESFSYDARIIADKWLIFLKKVFPDLSVEMEEMEKKPMQPLVDFALEYFFICVAEQRYAVEFSSSELLTKEEVKMILPIIQVLCGEKLAIGQMHCQTCLDHSAGEKPYHIDIVYLTNNGKDVSSDARKGYGEHLFTA